jgi:hypothetical protein
MHGTGGYRVQGTGLASRVQAGTGTGYRVSQ